MKGYFQPNCNNAKRNEQKYFLSIKLFDQSVSPDIIAKCNSCKLFIMTEAEIEETRTMLINWAKEVPIKKYRTCQRELTIEKRKNGGDYMFNVSKLEQVCFNCGGKKMVSNPSWQEYNEKITEIEEEIRNNNPDMDNINRFKLLDNVLEERGYLEPDSPEEFECPECEGRGTILTGEGSSLIAFIRKYI